MDKFTRNPDLTDLTEIQLVSTGQEATDSVAGIVRLRNNNLIRKGYVIFRDAVIAEPTPLPRSPVTSNLAESADPPGVGPTSHQPVSRSRPSTESETGP